MSDSDEYAKMKMKNSEVVAEGIVATLILGTLAIMAFQFGSPLLAMILTIIWSAGGMFRILDIF
jgi:hypothetical protein